MSLVDVIAEDDPGDGEAAPAPAESTPGEPSWQRLLRWAQDPNIAKELEESDRSLLGAIGMRAMRGYDIDEGSRSDWKAKAEKAVKAMMQDAQIKQYPWPGASNVLFPLMTTAALQFAARAYPAIIPGKSVVKGTVTGDDDGVPVIVNGQPQINPQTGQPAWQVPPGAKQQRADLIGEHMSWQLLSEQPEWDPETDKLLAALPTIGCVFRKTYFDPALGRNVSQTVSALNLVINYHAKSLDLAPRLSEEIRLYPNEIEEKIRAGVFLKRELGLAEDSEGDEDAPHKFVEQHCRLDLDEDGYSEPYVVTVHKQTQAVMRIVARYDADSIALRNPQLPEETFTLGDVQELTRRGAGDMQVILRDSAVSRIDPVQFYTQYDFLPNTDGGIYGVGFGHVLLPINEAVNTTLNQLLDAGHLANTGGGLIGKGLSMAAGAMRFAPGEYKTVNVAGGMIRDNVFPFPWKEPSPVLFHLLGLLIEAGREVASIKDVLSGENQNANTPATTTLAIIEQGLKVFTAIYQRIYRALKSEFAKLYRLNRLYLPKQGVRFKRGDAQFHVTIADYQADLAVEPVSDPRMVSDMQRLGHAQFLLGFAQDPHFNQMEIRKRVLKAAGEERIEDLLLPSVPPNPEVVAQQALTAARTTEVQIKAHELDVHAKEQMASAKRQNADAARAWAQAILFLSQADKNVGDTHLAWLDHALEQMRFQLDATVALSPDDEDAQGGMGGPAAGAPMGVMPAGAPGAPPALPSLHGPLESPPVAGAAKAPDGRWYVRDPNRAGKYLQVA